MRKYKKDNNIAITVVGIILGLIFGLIGFTALFVVVMDIEPNIPEDWYAFVLPLLIPAIVAGRLGVYYCGYGFGDKLLHIGKILLSAIAANIANCLVLLVVGIFYVIVTEPAGLLILLPLLAVIGGPTTYIIVLFLDD